MDIIHLILLGLVQGLTEFLPISSSAHLILLPNLMGWEDQGIVYDIAAHLGSLLAVLVYFREDVAAVIKPWKDNPGKIDIHSDQKLLLFLALATFPIAIVGYCFYEMISESLRNPVILAWSSIIFGLLLLWADRIGKQTKPFKALSYQSVLMIGLAQTMALIPGVSRSGITITAGLALGFDRQSAARFSFLLAIPTILLAGGHEALRYFLGEAETDWMAFSFVAMVSALSAYLAIHLFLKFIEQTGMLPYVIYRIILGVLILGFTV